MSAEGFSSAAEMAAKKPAAPPPIIINFSCSSTIQNLTSNRSRRKQGIDKSFNWFAVCPFSGNIFEMYHPGGFGNSNGKRDLPLSKKEPSLVKAVFFLVGMLLFWVLCFITGLELGMGWYAWPIGTMFLLGLSKSIFCFKKDCFSSMRELLIKFFQNCHIL